MLLAATGEPLGVLVWIRCFISNPQPSYLRIRKGVRSCILKNMPEESPVEWLNIRRCEKERVTCLISGATLDLVNQLLVREPGLNAIGLSSIRLWGKKTKSTQISKIEQFRIVITFEDQLISGGFESWGIEVTSIRPKLLARVKIKSLDPKVCGMNAAQSTLNAHGGLTEEVLCA